MGITAGEIIGSLLIIWGIRSMLKDETGSSDNKLGRKVNRSDDPGTFYAIPIVAIIMGFSFLLFGIIDNPILNAIGRR
ncbi:hypothetical protein [Agarilytica rhodophyticola]|uniref:hypothetical protein n=1 Tax=Agarilytica rhodophyticola TaxID=1737490 RepID=UPI000B343A65|nr:hypothetical protein [Agarilytica rhodophyticola]